MKKQILILAFVITLMISVVSASWWDTITGKSITGNAVINSNVRTCEASNGVLKYSYRTAWGTIAWRNLTDSCSGDVLTDYSCSRNGEKKTVNRNSKVCENGCENVRLSVFGGTFDIGRCISGSTIAESNRICNESDRVFGPNITQAGFVTGSDEYGTPFTLADSCTGDVLSEWSCAEDKKPVKTTVNCVSSGTGRCNTQDVTFNGVTQTAAYCQAQTLQCSDSDGGRNLTGAGVVNAVINAAGRTQTGTDRCVDNKRLVEYTCDANMRLAGETITCPDICQDGKCMERDVLCTDSDGGWAPATKGTVTNVFGANLTDSCMGEGVLMEFSCGTFNGQEWSFRGSSRSRSRALVKYKLCANGCENGACVNPTAEDRTHVAIGDGSD